MAFGIGGKSESLTVILKGKDQFSKVFAGAGTQLGGLSGVLKKVGIAAGVAAAAIGAMAIGIGVKAVKSAAVFEKAMGNVATLVDTSTESMAKMKDEILEMSTKMPVATEDLTAALYQVRSAGINAADAMSVLESSAKLAVAGLGTTEEATNLLTSAFNVFAKQGLTSAQMANVLFKTVKAGKTTVAELAAGFGRVAPIAGELNVRLEELQAATAALTTTGQSAAEAQTGIRTALVSLLKPTKDMDVLFSELGVTSGRELLDTSEGLIDAFYKLKEAAEKTAGPKGSDTALARAFGSVEALNSVLALTSGEVGETFLDTLADMESGSDDLTTAFNKQKETVDATWNLIKNQLNKAFIELGYELLPVVKDILNNDILPAFKGLEDWVKENKDEINNFFKGMVENVGTVADHLKDVVGYLGFIARHPLAAIFPMLIPDYMKIEKDLEKDLEEIEKERIKAYQESHRREIAPGLYEVPSEEEAIEAIKDILEQGERGKRVPIQMYQGQAGLDMDVTKPTAFLAGERGRERVTITPEGKGGNNFNFDFSGAFIGDIESFKKQIISLINRESELKTLGGV